MKLSGPCLGVGWAFLYGHGAIPAETFLPQARSIGLHAAKIYLLWHQLEPQPGVYDWSAVDAFVNQLGPTDEGLIALFSSSTWATRVPTAMLPPSPAKDPADYYRLVHALVTRCRGRVRYFQNDCEASNPVFWSGTAPEFIAQLRVFHRAVKDADPQALVVAGGYDGLFNPPPLPPMPNQGGALEFFDRVLAEGRDHFDLFDLRLYANVYTITDRVATMRRKMQALGYDKPIICTEYGGPGLFEFPVNRQYVGLVARWSQQVAAGHDVEPPPPGTSAGIAQLYETSASLAPETRMFLLGCEPALEAKYHRIQSRGIVMRNLLAFAAGVEKMYYWQFLAAHGERDDLMTLMYAKIGLFSGVPGALTVPAPPAATFALLTRALAGLRGVTRRVVAENPNLFVFDVARDGRPDLTVLWERRDSFHGEDAPPTPVTLPWDRTAAAAVDALGQPVAVEVQAKTVRLPVSLTPIFLE